MFADKRNVVEPHYLVQTNEMTLCFCLSSVRHGDEKAPMPLKHGTVPVFSFGETRKILITATHLACQVSRIDYQMQK
jgi:hypothetical protein